MTAPLEMAVRHGLPAAAVACATALGLCSPASAALTVVGAGANGSFTSGGRVDSRAASSRLLVQLRPERRAQLRFDVGRLPGPITRARLWLYAWSSGDGLRIRTLRGPWGMRAAGRRAAPRLGAQVALARPVWRRHWVVADVTRAVDGQGRVDLAVTALGDRPIRLGSRATRKAPRLEILTADAAGLRAAAPPGAALPRPVARTPSQPADTRPPTMPATLAVTRVTSSAIDVTWPAATDDVGVTSYRYYVDGAPVGSTAETAATITGLACGATYEVSVDAADAAGNRSARRTALAATRACPTTPASVFLAPGGNDAGPCTKQAPCVTLDRGQRATLPGQVVELAAGTYPLQHMTADGGRTGADAVVFRPAAGAAVVLADLEIEGASAVTFQDLTIADTIWVTNPDPDVVGSHDVTFDAVKAKTFRFAGRLARIAVRGGVFGGTVDDQPQVKKYDFGHPDIASPHDVLIDGATFRDFRASAPGVHTECLQLLHASVLTVRNSRFDVCDGTGAIGVTDGPVDHLTLENNFLGKAGNAFYAVQLTKNSSDVVVRSNSMSKGMIFSDQEAGGPWAFEGNYMPYHASLCTPGATHLFNVYAGGRCSASDLAVDALQFADVDAFDLHLAPGSAAIDRGNPASFPATDIDGEARPRGAAPDAGADEAG